MAGRDVRIASHSFVMEQSQTPRNGLSEPSGTGAIRIKNIWHHSCLILGMKAMYAINSSDRTNPEPRLPIDRWCSAIRLDGEHAFDELRAAYHDNWPVLGEFIFTPACEFQCQHCIYPPSYVRFNRGLGVEQWVSMLQDISGNLGIRNFVYAGRSLTTEGVQVLARLRDRLPEALIGVIDNGISMRRVADQLADLHLNWIDISLDGLEREHDLQRGRNGSFRAGLEGALWLAENGVAPKVNILTCLTRFNQRSVIPMLQELNQVGFRSFFITPVTIIDGVRPSPSLRPTQGEFAEFLEELRAAMPLLYDAWVEVTVFSATYAAGIARLNPNIWRNFERDRDGLTWSERSRCRFASVTNDLVIRYYPSSLSGTKSLIINTNGDVIVPKAVATGRISNDHVVGNLLQQAARDIVAGVTSSKAFAFYQQEFLNEKQLLKEYVSW